MKGIQTHTVTIGDSLQKLARMYGVHDWIEIAELNGLEHPYIDSVFGSKEYENNNNVAKIGSLLLIPGNKLVAKVDKNKDGEIESLAYGKDLDLYSDDIVEHRVKGELSEDECDIKTVNGLGNLSQQLKSRLSVKKGALLLHPEFGSNLHLYTGKMYKQETQNKILFEVERCLRTDFRVKDVKDLTIKFENGESIVTGSVIPIDPGQPFKIKYKLKGV